VALASEVGVRRMMWFGKMCLSGIERMLWKEVVELLRVAVCGVVFLTSDGRDVT